MRKKIIRSDTLNQRSQPEQEWLDVEQIVRVELTSEDPNFTIESALIADTGPGWRAAETGEQTIRLIFDTPRTVHRIRLEFSETEVERTQEFTLRWSRHANAPLEEIVRQQWTFSPGGSTSEVEDYRVQLEHLLILALTIRPELGVPDSTFATLRKFRMA